MLARITGLSARLPEKTGQFAGSWAGAALLDEHQIPVDVQARQHRHLAGNFLNR